MGTGTRSPILVGAGGDKVFYVAKISIRTPHFSAIIATKDSNARCQAEKLTACPKPGRGMQETLFPLLLNDAKCCLP